MRALPLVPRLRDERDWSWRKYLAVTILRLDGRLLLLLNFLGLSYGGML